MEEINYTNIKNHLLDCFYLGQLQHRDVPVTVPIVTHIDEILVSPDVRDSNGISEQT